MLQNKNYYFSRQKLEEIKSVLSKELRNNKGKLLSLFAKQKEFFHLAVQWEEAEWLEEKIEIPPKVHN